MAEYDSTGSHNLISTKNYLWIGSEIAEERDGDNNVMKRFFPQGEQQSGTNYYYTRDHVGSVRELVNGSGTLLSRYSYDPYGRVTTTHTAANTSTPPIDATFQFDGDYVHLASALNLTLYRAYDPNTARWLSRDPLKNAERLQGPNLYDYVLNNPIDLMDPLGTTSAGLYGQGTGFFGRGGFQVKLAVVYDFCQHKYCATISLSGLIGAGAYGGAGLGGQGNLGSGPITPGNSWSGGGAGAAADGGGASASAQWTPSGINGSAGVEGGEGGYGALRISRDYTACAGDPFTATADAFTAMVNELNALYQSFQ
jgi:RHS repeat-associated protein